MALKSLEELASPYGVHKSTTIVTQYNPHFNFYDYITSRKDEYKEVTSPVTRNFGTQEDENKILEEAMPLIEEELAGIKPGTDKDRLIGAQKIKYAAAGLIKNYKNDIINAAEKLCDGSDANICLVRYKYFTDEKLQARFELFKKRE